VAPPQHRPPLVRAAQLLRRLLSVALRFLRRHPSGAEWLPRLRLPLGEELPQRQVPLEVEPLLQRQLPLAEEAVVQQEEEQGVVAGSLPVASLPKVSAATGPIVNSPTICPPEVVV